LQDDVKGLKADCRPVPYTLTVESEFFGDDGKCGMYTRTPLLSKSTPEMDDVRDLLLHCRAHCFSVCAADLEVAVCDKGFMPKEFQLYTGKQCTKNKAS
jgi:hypothetical protein